MKLGILSSGALGAFTVKSLQDHFDIQFIATNSTSEELIKLAQELNISLYVGNPRRIQFINFLKDKNCDLLLSINYLFLIGSDVISFPKFYAINFHGSLLPKYRGRTPHIWAIINGEKTCGITAHLIEEGCDTGPIVLQHEVEISPEDTGQMILEKYKQIYPNIVKQVIGKVRDNKLVFFEQDNSKATFFGKRTPNDGKINWSWQKSRINNWIRAQAGPYPGAFTFYKGKKIIVDKIDFTDIGFDYAFKNGTILKVIDNIPFVKTPNGVVKLSKIRNQNQYYFLINSVLE